uniref:FAS1 domain-containing protein n=1 Tax=Plectus sambesii TaxID=2011161 RepID=A0A914XCW4_9BILA
MISLFVFALLLGGGAAQVDVTPLVEEWTLDEMLNIYTLVTWSTLIQDGDQKIVVDMPPMNETALEKKLHDALKERNLTPQLINKLVSTHGHPKNFGHNSAFPNAHQFFSTYEHNGKTFLRTGLYENGKMQLSPNVQLWYTPGNAPEDITVMVSNVPNRGIVAITGNLIFNSNDILEPSLWEKKAQHVHAGIKRRRKVICHANYVIPGHGPIFAVTDQHRDTVKCQEGVNATTEEQKRLRRQQSHQYYVQRSYKTSSSSSNSNSDSDSNNNQRQYEYQGSAEERQRDEERRRQLEYQRNLEQWQRDQEERRQQLPQAQAEQVTAEWNSNKCCPQQPCESNQPLCSSVCCSQPPCQANQPPCNFASSCCNQQQSCAWNQVKCQANCQQRQSCAPQPLPQQQAAPVQCDHTETHHHYIGAEHEIFRTHIRNEQNDLTTTLNDQQKQMRVDQEKTNQILLEYIGDLSSSIQQWVEEDRRRDHERNSLISRQKQEIATLEERQARELAELNDRPPQPPLDLRQDNVLRALEEHKRTADQWWHHQKQVEESKRAHEETSYRKVMITPARNYSTATIIKREPCRQQPAPAPQPTPKCTTSCDSGCTQGCNTGCAQGCNTGCAQGCNTGCAQGIDPSQQHRHLPGQRHYRRRRLRRHESRDERKQRKLDWLRTSQIDEETRDKQDQNSE